MGQSSVEWTDYTFNGWLGCAKEHAGCLNCYAEKDMAVVMRKGGRIPWGEVWQGGRRVVVSDSTWKKPLTWARAAARDGVRRRVFAMSLADVLEVPARPDSWPRGWAPGRIEQAITDVEDTVRQLSGARDRLWKLIRTTSAVDMHGKPIGYQRPFVRFTRPPGLDWLLLTKRPQNWRLVPEDVRPLTWLGTSVSDQQTADEWVPRLLAAQGFRVRFLSVEPLVGPVDLSRWLCCQRCSGRGLHDVLSQDQYGPAAFHQRVCLCRFDGGYPAKRGLDWVIVGGESGPTARPCNVEWVRSVVRQCREAGVPVYCKQLGASWAAENGGPPKGGDMSTWPEDLRVRELPHAA